MDHPSAIDFFKSCTRWNDDQRTIAYLESFKWDVRTALNAYFADISNQSRPDHRAGSRISPEGTSTTTRQTTANDGLSFADHSQVLPITPVQHSPIFPHFQQYGQSRSRLLEHINSNIIGKDIPIPTPFGLRKSVYADYTASGRSLLFVEQYLMSHVLPFYSNTHTENNAFAAHTTRMREASRQLIKKSVNATDEDVVIFTGPGSTSAINKLVEVLQLRNEAVRNHTVVFFSTIEHHSNILPWTETGVEWIRIPNNVRGVLDEDFLKQKLEEYSQHGDDDRRKRIICSFSAGSNVTGILTPVDRISTLVHWYKGWIFWDYAAAAPYERIDMNPSVDASKDAVFISTHKCVGGPGTPGLLIAKKKLFTNPVPVIRGGGTVNYVIRDGVEYVSNIEEREEGGTPDIIGSIRAGVVLHLKDVIGQTFISRREKELVERFLQEFSQSQTLFLLGPTEPNRLAIFSFLIFVPSIGKYLHHNFVCSLLNDLFGIQVRSGCSCAGPYVLDLLDMTDEQANIFTRFISENTGHRLDDENNEIPHNGLMKPGFTRFNLAYFITDEEVEYIIEAVKFVSTDGWRFLPLYNYNQEKGTWHFRRDLTSGHQIGTTSVEGINVLGREATTEPLTYASNENTMQPFLRDLIPSASTAFNDPIGFARDLSAVMPRLVSDTIPLSSDAPLNVPERYKKYIWFITPRETTIKLLMEYESGPSVPAVPTFRPRYNTPR